MEILDLQYQNIFHFHLCGIFLFLIYFFTSHPIYNVLYTQCEFPSSPPFSRFLFLSFFLSVCDSVFRCVAFLQHMRSDNHPFTPFNVLCRVFYFSSFSFICICHKLIKNISKLHNKCENSSYFQFNSCVLISFCVHFFFISILHQTHYMA